MFRLPRVKGLALVAGVATTIAGCASLAVGSFVERGTDLTQYRTYDWAQADQLSTGDPRLDNNPFFQERLQRGIEAGLASRRLEKVTTAPDLLFHYHASVSQQIDLNQVDTGLGSCESDDCGPAAWVYDAGTLVLDIVDVRTNRLIWRGWAEGSFDGVIDNQDWLEARIDEAVGLILERLPSQL